MLTVESIGFQSARAVPPDLRHCIEVSNETGPDRQAIVAGSVAALALRGPILPYGRSRRRRGQLRHAKGLHFDLLPDSFGYVRVGLQIGIQSGAICEL